MSPQPFEQWLFEPGNLSPDQRELLDAELARNPELRDMAEAWAAVESELRAASLATPRVGFSRRWRLKLAERKQRTALRRDWLVLGLMLGGAALTLALFGVGVMGPLASPAEFTKTWIIDLLTLQSISEAIFGMSKAMVGSLPLLLQISLSVTLLITAGWICTLWLASMYRFAFQDIRNGG